VFKVTSAILSPFPSSPIRFFARHPHVVETDDAVGERFEAHEAAAVLDLHARPVGLDDEAADLLRLGVARHHDEQLGQRAVRAPELLAVQNEGVAMQLGRGR